MWYAGKIKYINFRHATLEKIDNLFYELGEHRNFIFTEYRKKDLRKFLFSHGFYKNTGKLFQSLKFILELLSVKHVINIVELYDSEVFN